MFNVKKIGLLSLGLIGLVSTISYSSYNSSKSTEPIVTGVIQDNQASELTYSQVKKIEIAETYLLGDRLSEAGLAKALSEMEGFSDGDISFVLNHLELNENALMSAVIAELSLNKDVTQEEILFTLQTNGFLEREEAIEELIDRDYSEEKIFEAINKYPSITELSASI